ncbi:hypothetical protein A6A27_38440 [Micromonospora sp. CB01531]|nr:hypothetical protein A6A27_38440 [Micromonospora sp. CB01531]
MQIMRRGKGSSILVRRAMMIQASLISLAILSRMGFPGSFPTVVGSRGRAGGILRPRRLRVAGGRWWVLC